MKKIVRLTEGELVRIVRKIILETKTGKLSGREYSINTDGTVSIKNSKNEYVKVRFSALDTDINVIDISKDEDEYTIKTKNGTKKNITNSQVTEIITFVDGTKKIKTIETGMFTPNIKLEKK